MREQKSSTDQSNSRQMPGKLASTSAGCVWHQRSSVSRGGSARKSTQMTKEARRKGRLSQCGNEESQQNREELFVIHRKDTRDLEPGCTASHVIIETTHFLLRKLGEKIKAWWHCIKVFAIT